MNKKDFVFRPIGIIRSSHKKLSEIPIQPVFSQGIKGTVIVNPEFAEGLMDLNGFSHIYLFYYFHKLEQTSLHVKPYLSEQTHGIFATRAPHRPNKIGMSLVKLNSIECNVLYIEEVDILDETPLLDIKPYIRRFDARENVISGWQDEVSDDVAFYKGLRGFKKQ
ncbi:MAG: tRNA (N6-threonylcarbamoyladenosine(37)-N6)-methyltransferase TrmO [Dethiosulfovibrio peptidovorans]|nr:MAG: tRNA (N6-threonylcarbamoyladenosine(37)-N6)-methyltransferase TrmO [Dethiosulfovibrio peptidovorans]